MKNGYQQACTCVLRAFTREKKGNKAEKGEPNLTKPHVACSLPYNYTNSLSNGHISPTSFQRSYFSGQFSAFRWESNGRRINIPETFFSSSPFSPNHHFPPSPPHIAQVKNHLIRSVTRTHHGFGCAVKKQNREEERIYIKTQFCYVLWLFWVVGFWEVTVNVLFE